MKTLFQLLTASAFALTIFSAIAQPAKLNDAQIAQIVVTANTVDIEAGRLAEARSQEKQVQEFAKRMVIDHTGVNNQASELAKKLNITPAESEISRSLIDNGTKTIAKLEALKGKEFDKAYLDNEVAYHEAVLDALDKVLIPNAANKELKALLVAVRPAFVAHLEHARHIQSSIK